MKRAAAAASVLFAMMASAGQAAPLDVNKQAASSDAQALLASLRLPLDVTTSVTEPAGDGGMLSGGPNFNTYGFTDRAWWISSDSPQEIIDQIEVKGPAGAKFAGTGSGGNYKTGATLLTQQYVWPNLGSELYNRSLMIAVANLPDGQSGIVATSQSNWIVPRAASERVPSGVRLVDVTLRTGVDARGGRPRTTTHTFVRAVTVRKLVASINVMPIVQPGLLLGCPPVATNTAQALLTLTFKARPAGPPLTRAQVYVSIDSTAVSGASGCDPIVLWIRGRRQQPLTTQTFVKQVGRLIGADIS